MRLATEKGVDAMAKQPKKGDVSPIAASGVKFWTVAEVADTLRVSRMSVYRLIHSGELEAVQFGRSFRVSEAALDAYLKKAYFQTG